MEKYITLKEVETYINDGISVFLKYLGNKNLTTRDFDNLFNKATKEYNEMSNARIDNDYSQVAHKIYNAFKVVDLLRKTIYDQDEYENANYNRKTVLNLYKRANYFEILKLMDEKSYQHAIKNNDEKIF